MNRILQGLAIAVAADAFLTLHRAQAADSGCLDSAVGFYATFQSAIPGKAHLTCSNAQVDDRFESIANHARQALDSGGDFVAGDRGRRNRLITEVYQRLSRVYDDFIPMSSGLTVLDWLKHASNEVGRSIIHPTFKKVDPTGAAEISAQILSSGNLEIFKSVFPKTLAFGKFLERHKYHLNDPRFHPQMDKEFERFFKTFRLTRRGRAIPTRAGGERDLAKSFLYIYRSIKIQPKNELQRIQKAQLLLAGNFKFFEHEQAVVGPYVEAAFGLIDGTLIAKGINAAATIDVRGGVVQGLVRAATASSKVGPLMTKMLGSLTVPCVGTFRFKDNIGADLRKASIFVKPCDRSREPRSPTCRNSPPLSGGLIPELRQFMKAYNYSPLVGNTAVQSWSNYYQRMRFIIGMAWAQSGNRMVHRANPMAFRSFDGE